MEYADKNKIMDSAHDSILVDEFLVGIKTPEHFAAVKRSFNRATISPYSGLSSNPRKWAYWNNNIDKVTD